MSRRLALLAALWLAGCGPGVNPAPSDGDAGEDAATEDAGGDGGSDAGDLLAGDDGAPADADEPDGLDGSAADDGASDGGDLGPASRCERAEGWVSCPHETRVLTVGLEARAVHYQLPLGQAPAGGFPAAVFFQGAGWPSAIAWTGSALEAYGGLYQAEAIATLLDRGFAVLAPEAHLAGTTYWDTNLPAYAYAWELAPDHALMLSLLSAVEDGRFGALDATRLFAFGFSSGGYMTSRAGIAYPGRFRALAIQSGSYATCAGTACALPTELPADHPPTLFTHGQLDPVVPEWTMRLYLDALQAAGVEVQVVTDALAGHQWIPDAPAALGAWFEGRMP